MDSIFNVSASFTIVFLNDVLEQPWSQMSPGIHGDNLLVVSPLRKGTNVGGRLGVGEVGSVGSSVSNVISLFEAVDEPVIGVQFVAGDCKGVVNRVRTTTIILFSMVTPPDNIT